MAFVVCEKYNLICLPCTWSWMICKFVWCNGQNSSSIISKNVRHGVKNVNKVGTRGPILHKRRGWGARDKSLYYNQGNQIKSLVLGAMNLLQKIGIILLKPRAM